MKMKQPKRPNYDDLASIKSHRENRNEEIQSDIDRITEAVKNEKEETCRELHREIDGKYQAYVSEWGKSLYGYNMEFGIFEEDLELETIIHNLKKMSGKLKGLLLGLEPVSATGNPSVQNNINMSQEQSSAVYIRITFEEARQTIESMDSLSRDETDEIKKRIDELEELQKSGLSKKDRWAKVKGILSFVLDKGADIAIMMISLAFQTMVL